MQLLHLRTVPRIVREVLENAFPFFFLFLRRKELRAAGGLFSYRVGNNVLSVAVNCEMMLVTVIRRRI